MKQSIITCALIAMSMAACKKDGGPPRAELLTMHPWKVVEQLGIIGSAAPQNSWAIAPACVKDNKLVFGIDNKLTMTDETNVCAPGAAGSIGYTGVLNYTLSGNGDTLKYSSYTWQVTKLTGDSLVLERMQASNYLIIWKFATY